MDCKQLSDKYINCLTRYYKFIYDYYAETNINQIENLEKDILNLENEIYKLNIFSKNEELDDLSTSDLKYILFSFIKAECLRVSKSYKVSNDYFKRKKDLEELRDMYLNFLNEIFEFDDSIPKELFELIGDGKITNYISEHFADKEEIKETRHVKIMRFRKIKEFKLQLDPFFKSNFFIPDEYNNRVMYLKSIQLFFLETIEQILMIDNELQVLNHFTNNEIPMNNSESNKKVDPDLLKQKLNIHHIAPNIKYLTTQENNKLSFSLRDVKDDSIFNTKEKFRSKVFGPSHILPTISIAEAADIEISQAKEYEKTAEDMRRIKEEREKILNEKEYSKEEEEEEYKIRSWDDWKDLNPKGHGNTIKNIG